MTFPVMTFSDLYESPGHYVTVIMVLAFITLITWEGLTGFMKRTCMAVVGKTFLCL